MKPGHVAPGLFTSTEKRAIFSLSGMFCLRMYTLFLLLPVLALHVETLPDATPALIGLALGVYGLTQGLLQIPFGILSDRIGRKPVITIGLLLFALGSLIAALAESSQVIVIGRALQGAGAIASTTSALIADNTRDSQRTKGMALIGMSIGAAFLLAMMTASAIESVIGVPGIFWLTVCIALLLIPLLWFYVPAPNSFPRSASISARELSKAMFDVRLLPLYLGSFVLHALVTALFVVLPGILVDELAIPAASHWQVYLPVVVLSVPLMWLFVRANSRDEIRWQPVLLAIAVLAVSQCLFVLETGSRSLFVIGGLFVFFVGFNALEASLPSITSRLAGRASRGAIMGVFSSCNFFGMFVGGLSGGMLAATDASNVFKAGFAACVFWLLVMCLVSKKLDAPVAEYPARLTG
ncbi:MAG: MFS transporter [Arenicellales bacterium WSBS_2016_MAG_OTU3]